MGRSFRGGIHPLRHSGQGKKATEAMPVREMAAPQQVVLPMKMHGGAPCEPLVEKGQTVLMGQKIGRPAGFIGAPIHASVSGQVVAVEPRRTISGQLIQSVVIKNDNRDEKAPPAFEGAEFSALPPEQIRERVLECGVVGLGGAAFPSHVKLSPPADKPIDTLLINGAECEPYLTTDQRLMIEKSDRIVRGAEILMYALGAQKAVIATEDNKQEAFEAMRRAVQDKPSFSVIKLKTKYPQGSEKQLIFASLRRTVPSGGLPMDCGVVVFNTATAAAVADAVLEAKPLISRVITVAGSGVARPGNVLVRIGTSVRDVLEDCGGMPEGDSRVIAGGPMMGMALGDLDVPIVKGTGGVLVFTGKEARLPEASPCIRCARCMKACPMNLRPLIIEQHTLMGRFDQMDKEHLSDCLECGCCTYSCPAKRHLVHHILVAKREVALRRNRA